MIGVKSSSGVKPPRFLGVCVRVWGVGGFQ